jgi:hypothetical protein
VRCVSYVIRIVCSFFDPIDVPIFALVATVVQRLFTLLIVQVSTFDASSRIQSLQVWWSMPAAAAAVTIT